MEHDLSRADLILAQDLKEVTGVMKDALSLIFDGFYRAQVQYMEEAEEKTKSIEQKLAELQRALSERSSLEAEEIAAAAAIISHYQKITFDLQKLSEHTRKKNKEGILFTEKAVMELEELFRGIGNLFVHLNDLILTRNAVLVDHVLSEKRKYSRLVRQFAQEHEERLIKGVCLAQSSSLYLNMLDALEDILWHFQAMAEELKK